MPSASAAARRPNGGGAERIQVGKTSEREGRLPGSSPRFDLRRRMVGGAARRRGGGARRGQQWWPRRKSLNRPGNNSSRHGMGRSGVGARLHGSGCAESKRSGEGRSTQSSAAARARLCATRTRGRRRAKRNRRRHREGSRASARIRAALGRRGRARLPTRGRARRRPRWRYGRRGTVSSTGGALFARLNDFSPSLTS